MHCLPYAFPFTIYDLDKKEESICKFVRDKYRTFSKLIRKKEVIDGKKDYKSFQFFISGNPDHFEVEAYHKKAESKNIWYDFKISKYQIHSWLRWLCKGRTNV